MAGSRLRRSVAARVGDRRCGGERLRRGRRPLRARRDARVGVAGAGDPAIVAGETGAAGLALLLAAEGDEAIRRSLGIDASSRVLLIGSEGDTDPELYRRIVANTGEGAIK